MHAGAARRDGFVQTDAWTAEEDGMEREKAGTGREEADAPRLRPGDIVEHFKRGMLECPGERYLYEILSWARHSETDERYVVYRALYGTREVYVRPYDMFMSRVDREKYPEARQEFRFELAGPELQERLGGKKRDM